MEFLNDEDINKKSKEYYNKTKDIWRDNFHFEPPFGLINDPNGLSYYKGEYYIFFSGTHMAVSTRINIGEL